MKLLRTLSSLLLATLVLMASSSFYVGVHYCGGTVNAIAFLDQADGCGHHQFPPCHRKAMEGCCNDAQVSHEPQELKAEASTVIPPLSATAIVHRTILITKIIPAANPNPVPYFSDHPPALSGHDIVITKQSLLI